MLNFYNPILTGLTLPTVIDLTGDFWFSTIGASVQSSIGIDSVIIRLDREIVQTTIFGSLDTGFSAYAFLSLFGIGDDTWDDGNSSNDMAFPYINFNGEIDIVEIEITDTLGQEWVYTHDDLRELGFQTSMTIIGGYDYVPDTYAALSIPEVISLREGQDLSVALDFLGLTSHTASWKYYTTTQGGTANAADIGPLSGSGSFYVSSTVPTSQQDSFTLSASRDGIQEQTETAYLVVDLGYSSVSFEDGGSLKVIEIRILDDNLTIGGIGHDILRGTSAAETLAGGAGNDTYYVTAGDRVVETASHGMDTVHADFAYGLTLNVESLVLTGSAAINGTGNTLDNTLTGNIAANRLTGGAGIDRLVGNGGDDVLDGGAGADRMLGGAGHDRYIVDNNADVIVELAHGGTDSVVASVNVRLGAYLENLFLQGNGHLSGTGNALGNVLTGNTGNNVLDGGTGADTMRGGQGDDIYVVDSMVDRVIETSGQGSDLVRSSVSLHLAANVENLVLTGTGAINGTGNALNNRLTGNAGANQLVGGAGNDILNGGAGRDTIMGGAGNDQLGGGKDSVRDVFVFKTLADSRVGAERDWLLEFQSGIDDIDLSALDANNRISGNQDFEFSGLRAAAYAVWFVKSGANTLVRADVTGDKIADFELLVVGQNKLIESDFLM